MIDTNTELRAAPLARHGAAARSGDGRPSPV